MLDSLAVDPFADQLLLAAHVVDQPMDRFGVTSLTSCDDLA